MAKTFADVLTAIEEKYANASKWEKAYWRARRYNTAFIRWFHRTIRAVPVREFIQRGRRGWADSDTWSLDTYLNRVTGEAMKHMVATNLGWPGEHSEWPTSEEWDTYCLTLAQDMLDWDLEWRDDESIEEHNARFDKSKDAWYRFANGFGHYWT